MTRRPDPPRLRLVGSDPDPAAGEDARSAGAADAADAPSSPRPPTPSPLVPRRRTGSRPPVPPLPVTRVPGPARGGPGRPPPRVIDPARTLRPVGPGASRPPLRAVDDDERARFNIARENRQAATRLDLDPTDPRWVLAVRTASQMQGGVLTPERRERVMRTADQLGVRPFDAGIVIALVQDRLRRGGHLGDLTPQLGLLSNPVRRRAPRRFPAWARFAVALVVATAANLLLIRWLLGP